MNKWLTIIAAGIIIGILIAPEKATVVLKKITGKIKDTEDDINDKTDTVLEKIENTAAAIHKNAMK